MKRVTLAGERLEVDERRLDGNAAIAGAEQPERGYVERITPKKNRRTKQAFATAAGAKLANSGARLIRRAEERILKVLNQQEQKQFMQLLVKLVDINNTLSRAPLRIGMPRKVQRISATPPGTELAAPEPRARLKGREL